MPTFDTSELVSATSASRRFGALLNDVSSGKHEKIGILRNNRIDVVMISAEEYERQQALLERAEDLEIAQIVAERSKTPKTEYVPFETVLKKNGYEIAIRRKK
jgi:PHD/YefM family antitoxin component YafN of YafNO toxin-antitoxin module